MPFEITMPQLGLTMEVGIVLDWLIQKGERFTPGQAIVEIETDKATVQVEANREGTLQHILVFQGQAVPVGTTLALATSPGETLPANWQPDHSLMTTAPVPAVQAEQEPENKRQASWQARTLAREAGLSLDAITGSGSGGRITSDDVTRALAAPPPPYVETARATPVATKLATSLGLDLSTVVGSGPGGRITQTDVLEAAATIIRQGGASRPAPSSEPGQAASVTPLSGVRQIVSTRMAASARTTARVTLFRQVDATGLDKLRERFQAQGLHVSYNDILVHICAIVLREHPHANARMGDGQIERLDRVHIGLAVDTERGLLAPVIHDADALTMRQIAEESARLIDAARAGRSQPDDLTGGAFTITNLGMFGVEGFTPIINLPECCILGVGRIVRKPVVCDEVDNCPSDTVTVRPMMTLSLAFDHRVIDGAPAARFLDRIAQLIQDPWLLLAIN